MKIMILLNKWELRYHYIHGDYDMNKTKTPTIEKVTFPLRLPPKMYKQIRAKVNEIKENENYAYIINDFLTEVIEKGLKETK